MKIAVLVSKPYDGFLVILMSLAESHWFKHGLKTIEELNREE